jgi:hypothetical protein
MSLLDMAVGAPASVSRRSSSSLSLSCTPGRSSLNCSTVRALMIDDAAVGCAASQDTATAAAVVACELATASSDSITARLRVVQRLHGRVPAKTPMLGNRECLRETARRVTRSSQCPDLALQTGSLRTQAPLRAVPRRQHAPSTGPKRVRPLHCERLVTVSAGLSSLCINFATVPLSPGMAALRLGPSRSRLWLCRSRRRWLWWLRFCMSVGQIGRLRGRRSCVYNSADLLTPLEQIHLDQVGCPRYRLLSRARRRSTWIGSRGLSLERSGEDHV